MKASKLIQKLQEQIELHGDCYVWMEGSNYDDCYDDCTPVLGVAFEDNYYTGDIYEGNYNPIIFVI